MSKNDHSNRATTEVHNITEKELEPSSAYDKLRTRAMEILQKGGKGDPLRSDGDFGQWFWREAIAVLIDKYKWSLPSERLLVDLWNLLAQRQRDEKIHVPRAMLSQYLTEIQPKRGERQMAFRWALHTQAEDILSGHGTDGGFGKQWLRGVFGATELELQAFNDLAKKLRSEAEKGSWSGKIGFPEEVVRQLSIADEGKRSLFARSVCEEEFPLCRAYLSSLKQAVDDTHPNTTAKGDALEELASYLCGLLPGAVPQRNIQDLAQASEYDLLVSNLAPTESLTTSAFGREFIVECKNWEKKVGAKEIGYFLFRMTSTRTRFGIMWSKEGVSGKPGRENASRALIRREFQQHGNVCVVIDENDINQLVEGTIDSFQAMLLTKIDEFRFGAPKK